MPSTDGTAFLAEIRSTPPARSGTRITRRRQYRNGSYAVF
jgi:hypothetical protein